MEQTQISYQDRLMVWFQLHARHLVVASLLIALVLSVVFYMTQRRHAYLEEASILYNRVTLLASAHFNADQDSEQADNTDQLIAHIDRLEREFPKLLYARYASLIRIRLFAQMEDYESAIDLLDDFLVREDLSTELYAFAVLQKSRVLIAMGDAQNALLLMDETNSDFMSPIYTELRADVYADSGRWDTAFSLYRNARTLYGQDTKMPISLLMKLQIAESMVSQEREQEQKP